MEGELYMLTDKELYQAMEELTNLAEGKTLGIPEDGIIHSILKNDIGYTTLQVYSEAAKRWYNEKYKQIVFKEYVI